jgi:hypothetical protein
LSHCDWLKAAVQEEPDITLMEHCAKPLALVAQDGVQLQRQTVLASQQNRPDVARARLRWREGQANLDP